jgi:drug/metabolite transporter (DMT)-like permease/ADP-ribose pyrophosphatase YjhB (NUDIX family)
MKIRQYLTSSSGIVNVRGINGKIVGQFLTSIAQKANVKISSMKQQPASRLTRGYLICIAGTVLWSTTAIFIRYLTETYNLPALVLAFWRDLTLALTLGLFFLMFNRARLALPRGQVRFMLLYGLILSLFNSLWTISVALNGAAVSTVLAYSSAGFTAVLGWRLFGERLGRIKVLAVTLSLLGCVFVSGAYDPASWQLNPLGVITGLLSGLAFASYSLMGKEALRRSIDPWTVLLYAFGFAAVFLLVYNWLTPLLPQGVASGNLLWLGDAYLGWLILIVLAVGPTVGGYGLYTVSLKYLPASVANIIATLEPVMTAAQAFVLLGERFTTPQWIGGVLIVTGVIVLRQEEQADAPPAQGAQEAFTRCLRYQGAIVKDHHLLLIRHQEHASGRDYWIIPGGGRLDGESEEACVAREMKEETNLEVTVRRLLLDEYWETNHGSHHHKTYLCEPLTGQASPGYEPELESSQHYAIVEVKWFDLRSEASWGEKVVRDPITYPLMLKLRAALGYASEPPASAPAIHATPMEP